MISENQRLQSLIPPKDRADVVIDTATYNEIDDQFAISYALGAKDRLSVRALYAAPFYNARSVSPADGMQKSYDEILKLLRFAGVRRDVFAGSECYLQDEKTPVVSPAAQDLSRRAMDYTSSSPLYVVALGAITNVASALLMNPEIAGRIVIVWLGGNAAHWHDNHEFNISQDIAAARVVFASGAPLVIVPCMGVASAFTTTGPELEHWMRGRSALCDYLIDNTIAEAESYARGEVWSRPIWDVTAVGWMLNQDGSLELDRLTPTPIPQYDDHYSFDSRHPMCRMVYHINRDALFSDMVKKIINCR